jgi:hypothetical protein
MAATCAQPVKIHFRFAIRASRIPAFGSSHHGLPTKTPSTRACGFGRPALRRRMSLAKAPRSVKQNPEYSCWTFGPIGVNETTLNKQSFIE